MRSGEMLELAGSASAQRGIRVGLGGLFQERLGGIADVSIEELGELGIAVGGGQERADRELDELGIAPVSGVQAHRIAKRLDAVAPPQLGEVELALQERDLRAVRVLPPRLGRELEPGLDVAVR